MLSVTQTTGAITLYGGRPMALDPGEPTGAEPCGIGAAMDTIRQVLAAAYSRLDRRRVGRRVKTAVAARLSARHAVRGRLPPHVDAAVARTTCALTAVGRTFTLPKAVAAYVYAAAALLFDVAAVYTSADRLQRGLYAAVAAVSFGRPRTTGVPNRQRRSSYKGPTTLVWPQLTKIPIS